MNPILDDLDIRGLAPRRVSGTHGGEYHCPCPACGGNDRFHVWPDQGEAGTWWCRGCDKGGDAIEYLMEFCGKTFREAAAAVGRDLEDLPLAPRTPRPRQKPAFVPVAYTPPVEKWREKAGAFVDRAHGQLLDNPEQLRYLAGRGVPESAVRQYRLGYNPGENGRPAMYRARSAWGLPSEEKNGRPRPLWIPRGIVIPLVVDGVVHRIRIRREKRDLTPEFNLPYFMLPGSSAATMVMGDNARAFVVVEAELDAVACVAAAGDICGAVAVGSSSTKPDETATEILKQALCILNALDFDDAGKKAFAWWRDTFTGVKRWPVPEGKDPGEAFEKGIDLRAWLLVGLPPVFRMAGLTLLDSDSGEEEEREVEDIDVSEVAGNIRQVAEWFRQYPISVIKDGRGIRIQENPSWSSANRELSRRINLAVFMDPAVFDYVSNHPARVVDGNNFFPETQGQDS
ncbi:primase-helicase zinc-binding domain-containing protein [uncultured Desulfosarcina sp.]|uniref:primase-helicase zinc-binding domain-containing protein n=1 Tax=uncultured Desulfosarcina sp. TaxID=218289 RepID=UPI0029C920F1|nr:primase-helicase zinc-binding domain-containing protein [uncultured Desulfosarcina sp.]